jgi:hypothetical protein
VTFTHPDRETSLGAWTSFTNLLNLAIRLNRGRNEILSGGLRGALMPYGDRWRRWRKVPFLGSKIPPMPLTAHVTDPTYGVEFKSGSHVSALSNARVVRCFERAHEPWVEKWKRFDEVN